MYARTTHTLSATYNKRNYKLKRKKRRVIHFNLTVLL